MHCGCHCTEPTVQATIGMEDGDCFLSPVAHLGTVDLYNPEIDPEIRDQMNAPGSGMQRIVLIPKTMETCSELGESHRFEERYRREQDEEKMARQLDMLGYGRPDLPFRRTRMEEEQWRGDEYVCLLLSHSERGALRVEVTLTPRYDVLRSEVLIKNAMSISVGSQGIHRSVFTSDVWIYQ